MDDGSEVPVVTLALKDAQGEGETLLSIAYCHADTAGAYIQS